MSHIHHSRRDFLHTLTAGATLASLTRFGVSPALAQSVTDYKALVCIFLFGGNAMKFVHLS